MCGQIYVYKARAQLGIGKVYILNRKIRPGVKTLQLITENPTCECVAKYMYIRHEPTRVEERSKTSTTNITLGVKTLQLITDNPRGSCVAKTCESHEPTRVEERSKTSTANIRLGVKTLQLITENPTCECVAKNM